MGTEAFVSTDADGDNLESITKSPDDHLLFDGYRIQRKHYGRDTMTKNIIGSGQAVVVIKCTETVLTMPDLALALVSAETINHRIRII